MTPAEHAYAFMQSCACAVSGAHLEDLKEFCGAPQS